ncbi:YqjF family protein [Streptomyces sp. NPDC058731]|uniref:YqjF family protein n=1 Tax=Streptomyces sp. NPDC058731 TaxID=3346613 RepID=UPI0036AD6C12
MSAQRSPRRPARGAAVDAVTPLAPRPVHRAVFRQFWRDLVFVHWEADPFEVARLLPPGTAPDLFQGRAHAGLIFFRMQNLAPGPLPSLPYLGGFDEINVRLYSKDALGRRGVVFRSLDCDRLVPVLAARAAFGLPYRWAHTSRHWYGDRLMYRSRRRGASEASARVWLEVGPDPVEPGPLEEFLTHRWGLHTQWFGRTWHMPLTHPRWTFRRCGLLDVDASVLSAAGLTPPAGGPVSALYAPGLPVRFGPPTPLPPMSRSRRRR